MPQQQDTINIAKLSASMNLSQFRNAMKTFVITDFASWKDQERDVERNNPQTLVVTTHNNTIPHSNTNSYHYDTHGNTTPHSDTGGSSTSHTDTNPHTDTHQDYTTHTDTTPHADTHSDTYYTDNRYTHSDTHRNTYYTDNRYSHSDYLRNSYYHSNGYTYTERHTNVSPHSDTLRHANTTIREYNIFGAPTNRYYHQNYTTGSSYYYHSDDVVPGRAHANYTPHSQTGSSTTLHNQTTPHSQTGSSTTLHSQTYPHSQTGSSAYYHAQHSNHTNTGSSYTTHNQHSNHNNTHSNTTPHSNTGHNNAVPHSNVNYHANTGFDHQNYIPSITHFFNIEEGKTIFGNVMIGLYAYDKNIDGYGTQDTQSITVKYTLEIRRIKDGKGVSSVSAWRTLLNKTTTDNYTLNTIDPLGTGNTNVDLADGTYEIRANAINDPITANGVTKTFIGQTQLMTVTIDNNDTPTIAVKNPNEFINFTFGLESARTSGGQIWAYGSGNRSGFGNVTFEHGIYVYFQLRDKDQAQYHKGTGYVSKSGVAVPNTIKDIVWVDSTIDSATGEIVRNGYYFLPKADFADTAFDGNVTLNIKDYTDSACTVEAGANIITVKVSATDTRDMAIVVEAVKPTISFTSSTGEFVVPATITINYSDPVNGVGYGSSGINYRHYKLTNTEAKPTSGWVTTVANSIAVPVPDTNQTQYLHAEVMDNAGNYYYSVKAIADDLNIADFIVTEVKDLNWMDSNASTKNITVPNMAIDVNSSGKPIKMGYAVHYKLTSTGLIGAEDKIEVAVKFYNTAGQELDIYYDTDTVTNVPLGNNYKNSVITTANRTATADPNVHVWNGSYHLPATAKAVLKGRDVNNPANIISTPVVVNFTIYGVKMSGATEVSRLNYTDRETGWSTNKPAYSFAKGNVFLYSTTESAIDDLGNSESH